MHVARQLSPSVTGARLKGLGAVLLLERGCSCLSVLLKGKGQESFRCKNNVEPTGTLLCVFKCFLLLALVMFCCVPFQIDDVHFKLNDDTIS